MKKEMPAKVVSLKQVRRHLFPIETDIIKDDHGARPCEWLHDTPLGKDAFHGMHGVLKEEVPVIDLRRKHRREHFPRVPIQKMNFHLGKQGARALEILIPIIPKQQPIFPRDGDIRISVVVDREDPRRVVVFLRRHGHRKRAKTFEGACLHDDLRSSPANAVVEALGTEFVRGPGKLPAARWKLELHREIANRWPSLSQCSHPMPRTNQSQRLSATEQTPRCGGGALTSAVPDLV
jgi:hypothetical protein